MDLLELFKKISELYPSYRKQRTTNSADPAYQLVVKSAPELLIELSGRQELLKFEGSTGRGYITPAPWIAAFHSDITTSATDGFYLVYLHSLSMKRLVLEIGLGATQFENRFKGSLNRRQILDKVEEGNCFRNASDYIVPRFYPQCAATYQPSPCATFRWNEVRKARGL